jgi:outer membrane protein assembly factor BamB
MPPNANLPLPTVPSGAAPPSSWQRTAAACVAVSLTFCLLLSLWMIALWLRQRQTDPLTNTQFAALKHELTLHPENAALKERIRVADSQIRGAYWQIQHTLERGAWVLLGAAIVLVGSIKTHRLCAARPPTFDTLGRSIAPDPRPAQWALAGVAGAMLVLFTGGGLFLLATTPADIAPKDTGAAGTQAVAPAVFPTDDEMQRNWPVFRGWATSTIGATSTGKWSTDFDGPSGRNIVWKTETALPGHSSPVVWGNRIFLSGATANERQVCCYSLADGTLLWQAKLAGTPAAVEVNADTGYAAPTMAVDGQRAYALFATGDIAAFDLAGKPVWQRTMGKPDSIYGYAASLTLTAGPRGGSAVVVQWDIGTSAEQSPSALVALDGPTGKTLWQTPRPVVNSWASPASVVVGGKRQIITAGNPIVAGYDAAMGAELWRADLLSGDIAPSPAFAKDTVYYAQDQSVVSAVKATLTGDITKTGVLWQKDDPNRPDIVSPLADGTHLWMVTSSATVHCLDATDGTPVWEHEFENAFHASPILVNLPASQRELWLIDIRGRLHRLDPGAAFKELGTADLGEGVSATPAFVADKLVIRGQRHLFCIGKP